MPIYVYKCLECDKVEEHLFSVSQVKEKIDCLCGAELVRKFVGPARVWAPTRRSQ